MDRRFSTWVSIMVGSTALAGGLAVVGCATTPQAGGNLHVKVLDATSDKPSNVALHLSVGGKDGKPIDGLKPSNFRIFEDGKLVPEDKAKRMLLDPKEAEVHITVLLMDLGGPVVESSNFGDLIKQAGAFMERLQGTHQLTVSLFDGRDELRTVLEPDETDLDKALSRMRHYRPENRKSNVNGAVVKALAIIDRQLAASKAAKKVANLVVFSDRGDEAKKVPEGDLEAALDKTPADVYVLGVGPGIKRPELGKIARTDAFYSTQLGDLEVGFEHLSKHLAGGAEGQYLLSYCSPKRKGNHSVEIEVVTEKEHGMLTHKFSADGFAKGCSPKNVPSFVAKGEKKEESAPDDNAEEKAEPKMAVKAKAKKAASDDEGGEKAEAPATEAAADDASGEAVPAAATSGKGKKRKAETKADKEE